MHFGTNWTEQPAANQAPKRAMRILAGEMRPVLQAVHDEALATVALLGHRRELEIRPAFALDRGPDDRDFSPGAGFV